MKTLIAIPCMDMVHTTFMRSLIGMNRCGETQFAIACSSLIYDARNQLVKKAIDEKFDRILWLDSDMDFQPDLMNRLSARLDEGRDLVTGIYFSRRAPVKPVFYEAVGYYHDDANQSVTPHAVPFLEYPKDSLFEIQGCGFGGVMHTVELAKKVQDKYGVPFAPILGFAGALGCLAFLRARSEVPAVLASAKTSRSASAHATSARRFGAIRPSNWDTSVTARSRKTPTPRRKMVRNNA